MSWSFKAGPATRTQIAEQARLAAEAEEAVHPDAAQQIWYANRAAQDWIGGGTLGMMEGDPEHPGSQYTIEASGHQGPRHRFITLKVREA